MTLQIGIIGTGWFSKDRVAEMLDGSRLDEKEGS